MFNRLEKYLPFHLLEEDLFHRLEEDLFHLLEQDLFHLLEEDLFHFLVRDVSQKRGSITLDTVSLETSDTGRFSEIDDRLAN